MLPKIYNTLYKTFGPQHWWPGDSAFEIIIGAILTQNTNWRNVEKAILNLKAAHALTPLALNKINVNKLAVLIRPAGYFNVKAKRIKNFLAFLFHEYAGNLKKMAQEDTATLRAKLLAVNGIGPETADSILLYAFKRKVFVIDAYTKRMLYRHGFVSRTADYHAMQELMEGAVSGNARVYNEYHALIVKLAKDYCRTKPRCEACPLKSTRYSIKRRCVNCFRVLGKSSCCDECLVLK